MSVNAWWEKKRNARSGHPIAGMGGAPSDDPRDQYSGGRKRVDEDRDIRNPPVPGAFGAGRTQKGRGGWWF
jgi:hypothetical protein